jgi:hypothetical protein
MRHSRTLNLIVGMVLVGGPAAGQEGVERRPVAQETLRPVTVQRSALQASPEASAAALERLREIPLLTPFGPANSPEYLEFKRQATTDPRVQAADQALEPFGPTAETAARVTRSFRGIDFFEAGVFRGDEAVFAVPPDPNVAASSTRVVHVVNLAIRMFTRDGRVLQTLDLNDFFGAPVGENFERILFDPKVIYDANGPRDRFYVVALETTAGTPLPRRSIIHLAVSRSANPGNLNPANWCFYRINGRRNAGTELDSWADYPSLGAGADALVINTNQFTFQDFFFTFSVVRAIRKLPLSDNAESCPSPRLFTFQGSNEPGDIAAFTLQPAQHLTNPSSFSGTTNPVYLTNTIYAFTTTYRVWRLRNVSTSPSLSVRNVEGNFEYGIPPLIPQRNDFGFLDAGDHRMLEAAGVGNALWSTHATVCRFPGSVIVSCARVLRIRVGQSPTGRLQAAITQQSTFGNPNEFLFWPGLAVNRDETVAVPFHFVSASRTDNNLSTWWVVKHRSETAFRPLRPLTTGRCQQLIFRTGDYSGAETDPVDLRSFWLSGERAANIPEFGGDCFWVTRIIRVTPESPTEHLAGADGNLPE